MCVCCGDLCDVGDLSRVGPKSKEQISATLFWGKQRLLKEGAFPLLAFTTASINTSRAISAFVQSGHQIYALQ
jgi:hypothetical protein